MSELGGATGSDVEQKVPPAGAEAPAEELWTHFAPEPPHPPGRAALTVRRAGRFLTHEYTLVAVGALVLAAAMNWQCVLHPTNTIPMDLGDPLLQAWQLAWAGPAVTTEPSQVWQDNTFNPDGYRLACSDTLL